MSGIFEILTAGEQSFRFRLKADDGTVVAVSPRFPDIAALVAGINAVRENAATGFVVDHRSFGAPIRIGVLREIGGSAHRSTAAD